VDAALALLDDVGLDALTMPRPAERLGVETMSLYRHVDDNDDLLNAVAEQMLSGVEVPPARPTTGTAGSSAICAHCGTRHSAPRPSHGSWPTAD
jgi:AcrR family transcriptional regulator